MLKIISCSCMTPIHENKLQLQSFFASFFISPINFKNRQMNFHNNISVSNKKPNPAIWWVSLSCTRRERALVSTAQHWDGEPRARSALEQRGAALGQVLLRCYQHWQAVAAQQQHMHILSTSGNAFLNINTSSQKQPRENTARAQHLYQLNNPTFPSEALRQNDF